MFRALKRTLQSITPPALKIPPLRVNPGSSRNVQIAAAAGEDPARLIESEIEQTEIDAALFDGAGRAVELSPNYGTAHQWLATLLAITGRVEEAKIAMQRALEIDPLSSNFLADMGADALRTGTTKRLRKTYRKSRRGFLTLNTPTSLKMISLI